MGAVLTTRRWPLGLGLAALVLLLAVDLASSNVAEADSGAREYQYVIGTGFLCGLDPSACPVIAMADSGDTIEVAGSGTFAIHPKSATGGGTFVHRDASGAVVGAGTWIATRLLAFHSYGDGTPQGLPEEFEGGRAVLEVQAFVGTTLVGTGVLRVDCLLGDHIPGGAEEGIRLAVQDGPNFNQEVSGFTVFIRE